MHYVGRVGDDTAALFKRLHKANVALQADEDSEGRSLPAQLAYSELQHVFIMLTWVWWVNCANAQYLHELGRGVEHAGSILLTPVFERYHDEADGLWDGQDKGKDPDGDNFNGGNQGDPDSLNTTPRGHCSIPE